MWKFFKSDGSEKRTALGESSFLAYQEFVATVSVTSTSEAAPTDVVSAPAIVCSGTEKIRIEFYAWQVAIGSAAFIQFNLWDGSTDLGRIGNVRGSGSIEFSVLVARHLIPSAGSHTYKIRATVNTGTGQVVAGAGGIAANLPGYIRITRDSNVGLQGPPGPNYAGYGITLPSSPVDGQEAIIVDSLTTPLYQWRFRYNALSTYADKWECIGGSPWAAYGGGSAGAGGVYTDWNSANPSFTIPRAGVYKIDHGAGFYGTIAGSFFCSVKLGAAATNDVHCVRWENAPGTQPISLARSIVVALALNDIVKLQGKASGGNLAAYYTFMEVIPVRVS